MMFQLRLMLTGTKVLKKSLEKSSKTAVEAINNIRTVAGLRCEGKVIEEYANSLKAFFFLKQHFQKRECSASVIPGQLLYYGMI